MDFPIKTTIVLNNQMVCSKALPLGAQVAIGQALELPSPDLVAAEAASNAAAEAAAYVARGGDGSRSRGQAWKQTWRVMWV